jgi:oxygen-independent coproporphyrinogen-3 oxidase
MGGLPVGKGIKLSRADLLRRDVIMQLITDGYLFKSEFADRYGITFDTYFAPELDALKPLEMDGLVNLLSDSIEVTLVGRLLIRTIATVFDIHTREHEQRSMMI